MSKDWRPWGASRTGSDKQQGLTTVGGKEQTPVTGLTLRILACIMVKKTRNSQLPGVTISSSPVISRDQLILSPPSEAECYISLPAPQLRWLLLFLGLHVFLLASPGSFSNVSSFKFQGGKSDWLPHLDFTPGLPFGDPMSGVLQPLLLTPEVQLGAGSCFSHSLVSDSLRRGEGWRHSP